jgi:NADPH-dependent curcumin reductase CurA
MEGFIVFDYTSQYGTALKDLAQWLSEGKLQRKETILPGGLEAAEHGLVALYEGINTGMSSNFTRISSNFELWTNFVQASYWLR